MPTLGVRPSIWDCKLPAASSLNWPFILLYHAVKSDSIFDISVSNVALICKNKSSVSGVWTVEITFPQSLVMNLVSSIKFWVISVVPAGIDTFAILKSYIVDVLTKFGATGCSAGFPLITWVIIFLLVKSSLITILSIRFKTPSALSIDNVLIASLSYL